MTDFERGAVWAMELLKKQLQDRQDALRQIERAAGDNHPIVSGLRNVIAGVAAQFEIAFVKGIRDAQKKE